jgi:ankyrin repeat protein
MFSSQVKIFLILFLAAVAVSCGMNPEKAREKLGKMGVQYTADSFVKSALEGDSVAVDLFLKAGMDVNSKEEGSGVTPLMAASAKNHFEIVKALLNQNADMNIRFKDGDTALILAAKGGHIQVVKALLDKGADINAQNNSGATALMYAALNGFEEIVKALLAKNADVNIQGKERGYTALIFAAEKGHIQVIKALLDKGADINARNKMKMTALMEASKNGHTEIVKLLLAKGAKATFTDNGNGTVTDNFNGLMWQQGENKSGYNWHDASGVCDSLSLAGYSDWRLPTIDELKTLIKSTTAPIIDKTFFPNVYSSSYWSSTTDASDTSDAWYVSFYNGYVGNLAKSSSYYARCVRGGQ